MTYTLLLVFLLSSGGNVQLIVAQDLTAVQCVTMQMALASVSVSAVCIERQGV